MKSRICVACCSVNTWSSLWAASFPSKRMNVCPFPHRGRHETPLSEHVYTSQQVVREGHFGAGDSCGCSLKNLPKHHSGARPVSAAQAVLSFVEVPRDALWNVIRGLKLFNLRVDVDQIESVLSRIAETLSRAVVTSKFLVLELRNNPLATGSTHPEINPCRRSAVPTTVKCVSIGRFEPAAHS